MTEKTPLSQLGGPTATSEDSTSGIKLLVNRSSIARLVLRIGRILVYVFGLWTLTFYFWNFIGIVIGLGVFVLSENNAWKRHGAVLSFIIPIFGIALHGYTWIVILLVIIFLIFYYIGSLIHIVIIGIKTRFSAQSKEQVSRNRFSLDSHSSIKIASILFLVLTPILLWSSVNLDLEVMLNNEPVLLWVHSPSTVNLGEEFEITVEAWDSFERLSANYRGSVNFALQSYNQTTGLLLTDVDMVLPDDYTFTAISEIPGLQSFNVEISTEGIHYILVDDSFTQNVYWSNPIIVDHYPEGSQRIYWGDIHCHTMVSDGSGTPEESYYYGRHVACLDYMALTDHGEHFTLFDREKVGSTDFENYKVAAANAHVPGEFVAFLGAEWTTSYISQPLFFVPTPSTTGGHYTCVFSGDSMPLFSAFTENTPDDLWALFDNYTSSTEDRVLAIPHHTIRSLFIQDWTLMNPEYVRLAEVTSVHGESLFDNELNYRGSVDLPEEKVNGSSIIDALNMGYRMTFIANGDNHDGHPGHSLSHTRASVGHQYPFTIYNARNGHPYPSGITAVYADSLTRNAVFTGLENGRVFASSDYGRPILDFSINNVSVGYNTTVPVTTPTSTRELRVFLAQDGAPVAKKNQAASVSEDWIPDWIATIEIIKNGVIWGTIAISDPVSMIRLTDNSTITGTSYESCIQDSDGHYYINHRSQNPIDPSMLHTNGMDYYALRVVGNNGRTSYIGSIWVYSM